MRILALLSIFYILLITNLLAQTRTIVTSGNWSNASSWQGGNIGGDIDNDDDVVMNTELSITIQSGESYTIASLDLGQEGILTIESGGSLIVTGDVMVDKEFTFVIDGDFLVEGDLISDKEVVLTVDGTMQVDGEFNLGSESTVEGTGEIIAPNCTGAACDDDQVLPITLGDFTAKVGKNSIELKWTTLSEENFEYFELQRADKSMEFKTFTIVNGNGNSKVAIDYTWTDEEPNLGINYYRLISSDFDGYRESFKAIYVLFESKFHSLSLNPNPAKPNSTIYIKGIFNELGINIYNMQGRFVKSLTANTNQFTLDEGLAKGLYIVEFTTNGLSRKQRLIIY